MKDLTPPFDPKLKEATKEIYAILKLYDINCAMVLTSQTHTEFLFNIDSSWSVMKFEGPLDANKQASIRFRSMKADFPSKEIQHQQTAATAHSITSMLQFGQMLTQNMTHLLEGLRKHIQIIYEVWK